MSHIQRGISKRNILLIQSDAQPFQWLGAAGHPDLKTPNLDRLAARGTLFRQAFTCSGVCVPSRASLVTGRYPVSHGVVSNNQRLPPSEPTLANRFAHAGYELGCFGKTHYGRAEESMADEGWHERFLIRDYNAYLARHGIDQPYPRQPGLQSRIRRYWRGGASPIPPEHYLEQVITDRALDFLRKPRSQPFFCWLSMVAPHGPFTPPPPWDTMYDPDRITLPDRVADEIEGKAPGTQRWIRQNQKYLDERDLRTMLALMYGLVSLVDHNVGRVWQGLEEAGLAQDTLVLFTSDHGDFAGHYGIIGKSWSMHDTLVRIPLIGYLPDAQTRGQRSDALVENVDILPTCLEFAGLPRAAKMQGASFLPALRGDPFPGKPHVFSYLSSEYSGDRLPLSMIRTRDWKLVQTGDAHHELYDLRNDPREARNVAGDAEQVGRAHEMQRQLLQWHVRHAGGYFDPDRAKFWEDETEFYVEALFSGERINNRARVAGTEQG